jgi:predicted PP-loop superfamily ATPase
LTGNFEKPTICRRCILPDTFPGISFDDQGICSHCRREEKKAARAPGRKADYRRRLDDLIQTVRDQAPCYDAVMAYSGGKDSSYTMKLLKEKYDLRILALTFDNHFISPASLENIARLTDQLDIDHLNFSIPWPVARDLFACTATRDIFPAPTLLRASAICTACIGIVKSLVLKTALEMSIPLVAFGWSPGQAPIQSAIMKTNPTLTAKNQQAMKNAYPPELGRRLERYLIPARYYDIYADRFPSNIHPLAFFDYDEEAIKKELQAMGWRAPEDTDTNSSNCLLNAFANQCHLERHGFHPYVWEIANMVRQGVMDREEGIEKIYSEQNAAMVDYAREKLEL